MAYLALPNSSPRWWTLANQDIHVDAGHHRFGPTWRRDSRPGGRVCGHHQRPDQPAAGGRNPVPVGLPPLPDGLRSADRVFTLCPLALIDKRPGVTMGADAQLGPGILGNFAGAFTVAVFMAIIFTFGFSGAKTPSARLSAIGEGRTVFYAAHGAAGHADTVHPRRAVQLMVPPGGCGDDVRPPCRAR